MDIMFFPENMTMREAELEFELMLSYLGDMSAVSPEEVPPWALAKYTGWDRSSSKTGIFGEYRDAFFTSVNNIHRNTEMGGHRSVPFCFPRGAGKTAVRLYGIREFNFITWEVKEELAILTEAMQKLIGSGRCMLATACKDGRSNIGPKGSVIVLDDSTLAYGELTGKQSYKNVLENPRVAIAVVDFEKFTGYRFFRHGGTGNIRGAL
jgi:hypothetical protein